MNILNSLRFHVIRFLSMKKCKSNKNFDKSAIYLTFDDGPEPGITEFILDELKKYNAKGTFFCKGENCVNNPSLAARIKEEGHTIANHSFSHINGCQTPFGKYIEDVERCEEVTRTHLFRPPWGQLTFRLFFNLAKKYNILLWDIASGDTQMQNFDLTKNMQSLERNTRPGSIVLFHFCKTHENETRELLPLYLQYLDKNGYRMLAL